jgi:hypothetical protein
MRPAFSLISEFVVAGELQTCIKPCYLLMAEQLKIFIIYFGNCTQAYFSTAHMNSEFAIHFV